MGRAATEGFQARERHGQIWVLEELFWHLSDIIRSGFGKECLASEMKPEGKRARLEESWSYLFEPHLRT